jgi:phospholipase A1
MIFKAMLAALILMTDPVSGAAESPLAVRWELEPETKQGTFMFRPHRQNYFLPARYSTRPNEQPVSPNYGSPLPQDYDNWEAKFQLSFKVKAVEGLFNDRADLWLGFTQQSSWQVYNSALSRPFRETNFEPEIMLVFPTRFSLLGLEGRMINVGLVHQSNGQSEPLSRSWNRIYVQFGFERGNFALLVRPWYRFEEDAEDDDNSDIDEFLGHGDVQAIYKLKQHTFSMLLRNDLRNTNRGAIQLDWSFPGVGQMKGYMQFFSGYGESMIDYNHHQTTIGLGLILTDVL